MGIMRHQPQTTNHMKCLVLNLPDLPDHLCKTPNGVRSYVRTAARSHSSFNCKVSGFLICSSCNQLSLHPPSVTSKRAIMNQSFSYSAPRLWYSLPTNLCTPSVDTPGTNLLSRSSFLFKLETYVFTKSCPNLSVLKSTQTACLASSWPPD